MRNEKWALPLLIVLLLLQLFLRAHNITVQPFFIDEDNHLRRASTVYDFDTHPAHESHGKFLLYLLLGVFDLKQRDTALHLGRTMVALTSLITTALIYTIVKRWSDARFGLLAAFFYACVPFAVFFERMALADPFAGLWGVLTLYQAISLAKRPTPRRALIAGICTALTVMAKLTMGFAVVFLPLGVILLAESLAWRRFVWLMVIAGSVFAFLWLFVLIPARISLTTDAPDFVLLNTQDLIENDLSSVTLQDKLMATGERLWDWTSPPLAVALLVVALWGVWREPHRMGFLLGCLLLAWLATLTVSETVQSRYLMSGVPILAVIFGVGSSIVVRDPKWTGHSLEQGQGKQTPNVVSLSPLSNVQRGFRGEVNKILFAALGLWALVFALPFARTATSDPPALKLPALDERNYFWDRYNGYGEREAFAYLQENGGRYHGRVWVMPLVKVCRQLDLLGESEITYHCVHGVEYALMANLDWQPWVLAWLQAGIPLYMMTSEQQDVLMHDDRFVWEKLAVFPKPEARLEVIVWRIRLK